MDRGSVSLRLEAFRRRGTGARSRSDPLPRVRAPDAWLAVVGAAAVVVEALIGQPDVSAFAYLLAPAAAAPIAFRRTAPLATLIAAAVGAVACAIVLDASWAMTGVVAIALFNVVLLGHRRRSLIVGMATAIAVVVIVLAIDGTVDAGAIVSRVALVVLCVAAGEVVRTRGELGVARRERAALQEQERVEQLRRAAAAERLAIAHDLHDSLGHFLVAINVRASVAVEVPESQDPTAALEDIKRVSATALGDLRATLAALREGDEHAPTAPAPGLDSLAELVEGARAAGVDCDLSVEIDGRTVPTATAAATVRIVQESLTNALKHAQTTRARVDIRADADTLTVDIVNNGAGTAARPAGFGVRGMIERAHALGGQLYVGPGAAGDWSVRARLPLHGREA